VAQGQVTSAYFSATLGKPIALGLLAAGRARLGETVFATALSGPPVALTVVAPVFHDPKGERVNG
jgi:sarcosine oxidase subunit alpha